LLKTPKGNSPLLTASAMGANRRDLFMVATIN
jgi:hypothetical protein